MDEDAWFKPPPPPPPPPGLARVLHAAPGPLCAAIDGAQFGDVAAELKGAGLSARPLFLGEADAENALAGPWLADVDSAARLDRLLALVGEKPAAVYWACPAGEAALYKHLRGINGALVPLPTEAARARQTAAAALGETAEFGPADYADERVLFRHYDPRVLAQVLPVLDERQFAQVLGPASLVVISVEGGPPLRAPALDPPVIVPSATLRLRPGQMDAISDARAGQSRRRIATYLRNIDPAEFSHLDDSHLYEQVKKMEGPARSVGLKSDQSIGQWIYLMRTTDGNVAKSDAIRKGLRTGSSNADDNLSKMIEAMLSINSIAEKRNY